MTDQRLTGRSTEDPFSDHEEGQSSSTTESPELVRDHLEDALGADTHSMKNYHIRSALQALLIETGHSRE